MYPEDYVNKEDDSSVYFFSSPFDPLNNWSAHAVKIWGQEFKTVEHGFHFKKFDSDNPDIAMAVVSAPSPWAAMQVERRSKNARRKDWQEVKVGIMEYLLRSKFEQNEDVRRTLGKTGKRVIIENSPWDYFWGCGEDGSGENTLGKLWMKIRDGK